MVRGLLFLLLLSFSSFSVLARPLVNSRLVAAYEYKVKVEVQDKSGQLIPATVTLTSDKNKTPRKRVLKTGSHTYTLLSGDTYYFEASQAGYAVARKTIRIERVEDIPKDEQTVILEMAPLGKTTPMTIVVLDSENGQPLKEGFQVQLSAESDDKPADSKIVTEPSVTLQADSRQPFRFLIRARGYFPHEHEIADTRQPKDVIIKLRRQTEAVVRPYDIRVMDGDYRYVLPRCEINVWDEQKRPVKINFDSYTGDWRVHLEESQSYSVEVKAAGFMPHRGPLTRPPQSLILIVMYPDVPKIAQVEETVKTPVEEAKPTEEAARPASKQDNIFTRLAEKLGRSEEPDLVGKTITLNNVYFKQGSYVVLPESYPQLDELIEALKSRPTMQIEVAGHTDRLGDPRMNLFLSENRAKSVYEYLVKKGIPKQRLRHKGYGFGKSIAPSDTEENRQKNRRVEVRIIEG
ncbi:OmpA family protein [Tellurirhabdus bombi]|uniref:OmpA family protein n=1 Tax=Tellurirhabdus bombi TaxID=2907205 RepID=UPI001F45D221|nr:OmpA family protein [Tellurirhabdus bombi]